MKRMFKLMVVAIIAITVSGVVTSCGKSQEWYDQNQNFGDLEGTWAYAQEVQGEPQMIALRIEENGRGHFITMIGDNVIFEDENVKLGRSKENLSVLFSAGGELHTATFHIKDGELYTNDWEPFEKQ
ncbi:MAG: hypothetical protein K2H18_00035 [Muribaculaceae bacterium]|nr:hypothetical protein [Muribaculaceae bacterium]